MSPPFDFSREDPAFDLSDVDPDQGKPIDRGPGYHLHPIERGVYGETSKILEEALELRDAEIQGVKIMALNEVADLLGAIKGYLDRHHPGVTLEDAMKMAFVTARAFKAGHRR